LPGWIGDRCHGDLPGACAAASATTAAPGSSAATRLTGAQWFKV